MELFDRVQQSYIYERNEEGGSGIVGLVEIVANVSNVFFLEGIARRDEDGKFDYLFIQYLMFKLW